MATERVTHYVGDDCPGGHRDECRGCGTVLCASSDVLCGLCELVWLSEDLGLYDVED